MCRFTSILRRLLGSHPYVWKPRPSTRTGARGGEVNGRCPYGPIDGLTPEECRMLEELERDHRLIRQMRADAERRRARGRDA